MTAGCKYYSQSDKNIPFTGLRRFRQRFTGMFQTYGAYVSNIDPLGLKHKAFMVETRFLTGLDENPSL